MIKSFDKKKHYYQNLQKYEIGTLTFWMAHLNIVQG